jgi:hypothetical protein
VTATPAADKKKSPLSQGGAGTAAATANNGKQQQQHETKQHDKHDKQHGHSNFGRDDMQRFLDVLLHSADVSNATKVCL